MFDLFINFLVGLLLVGIPSYIFYKIGIETGIKRGLRSKILQEWKMGGVIDVAVREKHRSYPD